MAEADDIYISPTLQVALDLWGQTLAYRAATIAQPRWDKEALEREKVRRPRRPPQPQTVRLTVRDMIGIAIGVRDMNPWNVPAESVHVRVARQRRLYIEQNYRGLSLSAWDLCRIWPRLIRVVHGYPKAPQLSPAVKQAVLALPGHGSGSSSSHSGDLRAIESAHITVCRMMLGEPGRRGAVSDIRSLVCWLYAVPWYSDRLEFRPTVQEWCANRFGGQCTDRIEAAVVDRFSRWVRYANGFVRSAIPHIEMPHRSLPDRALPPELHFSERDVWERFLLDQQQYQVEEHYAAEIA